MIRSSFQELKTVDSLGRINITDLSLPVIDLNLSRIEEFPPKGPHVIFFDRLELEETLSLQNGKISVLVEPELDLFKIQVFPLHAILTDLDIRLFGLSFNGLGNISKPLTGELNQVLTCCLPLIGDWQYNPTPTPRHQRAGGLRT